MASAPLLASPTISMSPTDDRIVRNLNRSSSWSSANSTLIFTALPRPDRDVASLSRTSRHLLRVRHEENHRGARHALAFLRDRARSQLRLRRKDQRQLRHFVQTYDPRSVGHQCYFLRSP